MQSLSNIFRQKTSEYLFELLLKLEVWYDILYCVTIPISVTEGRCYAWNFSLLYSPLSWQA